MTNINIKINEDDLINMLQDRIEWWTGCDDLHKDLLSSYYENSIDIFEEQEINIKAIVDNDLINWTGLLSNQDEEDRIQALICFLNVNNIKTKKNYFKLSYDKLFDKYDYELERIESNYCDCSCQCHFVIEYFSYNKRDFLIRF